MVVIVFAGKQYLLYRHCENLVSSSQQLLFQFTGIKEHVNETLVNRKTIHSNTLIKEIQQLDIGLQKILGDILIPEEFKLSFISQIDLVTLTVQLRNIENTESPPSKKELLALGTQLRSINTKLNNFHLLISRYTQKQLLGLHQTLAGFLAMSVALVTIMLLTLNTFIISPILAYCRTHFPEKEDDVSLITLHKTLQHLASNTSDTTTSLDAIDPLEFSFLYRYSSIGHLLTEFTHELTNISNGSINYTQAIIDLTNDSQLNEDTRQLLHKLYNEEKKLSQILKEINDFSRESVKGTAKAISLDDFFDQIATLVSNTLNNEGVEFVIPARLPATLLSHHVSDIQLVILSALQNCRVSLNSLPTYDTNNTKKIILSVNTNALQQGCFAITILDNGSPRTMETLRIDSDTDQAWHSMNLCEMFLQSFNGSLTIVRQDNKTNICTITAPLHQKETSV